LVHAVDRRQPHDPCALSAGDLDCYRVETTNGGVERESPEDVDARDDPAHNLGALSRRDVVRLQDEAGHPDVSEPTSQRDIVHQSTHDVRGDVDVRVVGTGDELTCSRRRCGCMGHRAS